MTERDRYWLAGLLEGEGCFYVHRDRRSLYGCAPGLVVNMTDRDVIERAARLIESSVVVRRKSTPRTPHYAEQYAAQRRGEPAAKIMMELWPLMGSRRRRRILEVIWECDPGGTRFGYTDSRGGIV